MRAFLLLFAVMAVAAQEKPYSGPQPGETLTPFRVLAVNGPEAGRETDFVSQFGKAPILLLFVHDLTRPIINTFWPIDRFAGDRVQAGLKILFVYTAGDRVSGERRIRDWDRSMGFQVPMSVSLDGSEGPGLYGLNREVPVTAILAREGRVVANVVITQPGYPAALQIISETAKLVGGRVPAAEEFLRGPSNGNGARLVPLSEEADFLYGPPKRGRSAGYAGALSETLRRAARPQAREADVDREVADLRAWAGSDVIRGKVLASRITPLLEGGISLPARVRLQRLKQDLETAQIFSGPQAAEALAPFKVLAVNGPEAGKEVDFITQFGDDPTFLIFIHHLDRLAEAFILPCERFAQERAAGGLKTLYVYLAPDKVEGERTMRAALAEMRLHLQVGVSVEGAEGPGSYGLNREVAMTILFARNRRVVWNFVLTQPSILDSVPILTELAAHVGGRVRTRDELEIARRIEFMMRTKSDPSGTGMSSMIRGDPPELMRLLWSLKSDNSRTDAEVDRVLAALRRWAGTDPSRCSDLALRLGMILPLKYGTEYAQTQIAALQAELDKY
jgi:hypothetical protein